MSIFKVAKVFKKKLALASGKAVEDLRKVMGWASSLASSYDYSDAAYDTVQNLAAKSYQLWSSVKNPKTVMTASQLQGHLNDLKRLAAQVGSQTSDAVGKKKLNTFNSVLNSVQPVDIGQTASPVSEPPLPPELQDTIHSLRPQPLPWEEQYPQTKEEAPPVETPKAPGRSSPGANLSGDGSTYSEPQQRNFTPSSSEDENKVTQPSSGWSYKPYKWQ